ncbi:MAG: mechanosensitive ion channel domain-containing protein [Paracoccaceae bacterium]
MFVQMWRFCLGAVLTLMLMLPMLPAQAQGLGTLLTPTESASDGQNYDQILKSAAENGVSVVVIDSDGNIITQGGKAESEATDSERDSAALMKAQSSAVEFRAALVERLLNLPAAFNEVMFVLRKSSPDGTIWAFVEALLLSLLMFAIGMLFQHEVYGKRIVKNFVVSRIMENPVGYREKMPFLVFRFVLSVVGILVSMVVAYMLGTLIFGSLEDSAMQFTVTLINIGYLVCRVVSAIWRMILSPYLSQYRIPLFSDRDAKLLHWWLTATVSIGATTILFGIWIGELGLNYEVYAFLASLMSFSVMLLNMIMVAMNRAAITNALMNGKPKSECSWLVRTMATVWLPLAYVYLFFAWIELTYDLVLGNPSNIPLIAGAYGILTTIIVVYGVINFFIERSFARARAIRAANALDQQGLVADIHAPEEIRDSRARITTFEGLARRVAGILAFVAGIMAFIQIWQPETAMVNDSVSGRMMDMIVILFIGYIIYNVFRIWVDSKIAEEQGDAQEAELGDEGGGSSASRLATLLPLFRNFILIVIIVTIALITLMEMGVNVGPLFAGAGIVGVAVGFGSQSLVRDIFSGAFFLFDDAFRKGEYIDVGGVKGTVENISVRSFQLRHHLGALHTIPFGEIQVLTNYSRDWVIMKLPLRVTYDTDVERVRKLIKNLGVDLQSDPVIGDTFIQPLKSQGVIEMQDSAMIIRVKFMTKPGDQWLVRKKVYEEIRMLFEREGVKFAHREVTVRLADGKVDELDEHQKHEIVAASREVIEEEMAEAADGFGDDR